METVRGVYTYLDFHTNLNYLTEDLVIVTQTFNKRLGLGDNDFPCIVVPKGSKTDGGSIPVIVRPLAMLSPRSKAIFRSAIGHDMLYKDQSVKVYEYCVFTQERYELIADIKLSRKECDEFIRDDMKDIGANFWQVFCTYFGLRIGGWYMYGKAKNLLTKQAK